MFAPIKLKHAELQSINSELKLEKNPWLALHQCVS
jgi:hypothetical protein